MTLSTPSLGSSNRSSFWSLGRAVPLMLRPPNSISEGSMGAGLMAGKRGLIMGVANDRSIAWAISKVCHEQGAELAFTYQGEALLKRVTPLAASIGSDIILPCDVSDESTIDAAFNTVRSKWGK